MPDFAAASMQSIDQVPHLIQSAPHSIASKQPARASVVVVAACIGIAKVMNVWGAARLMLTANSGLWIITDIERVNSRSFSR